MAFDLQALLRPNIRQLVPYATARDEFQAADDAPRVMLDANENPYDTGYNRYPDPLQHTLKAKIAQRKGVAPESIFLGNGSDEAIDLLLRAFCRPGHDAILIQPPTYGMYQVAADIHDLSVVRVPLGPGFVPQADTLLQAITPQVKVLFFCSPNNPTGNLMPMSVLERVLTAFDGIVVVDEAYADYAPTGSILPRLSAFPNLVVLQTFSKAWGMAGIRLGMAFAQPAVVQVLNRIKAPYNVSQLTQQAALNGLDYHQVTLGLIELTLRERARLAEALAQLPAVRRVYPSDANFLLVQVAGGRKAYDFLLARGIIVRDRSAVPGTEDCLRITVGTADENDALIAALRAYQA